MFIASLLTNPETPKLDRVAVESLRNAWGGGDAVWLDPGVAAEFALAEMPANRWGVWQEFQAMGVDLVVQEAEGRKKRLLIADMDSTMNALMSWPMRPGSARMWRASRRGR
jgi:phosphoserine phosphatase